MTSSRSVERRGSQKPRVLTRPDFATEAAGDEAIELAASVGLILDPWQQLLTRLTLAERADGRYAADTVAALVARQNGKGGWLEAVALHGMFLVGDPLTLWTAHQTKTSFEGFLRIKGWIDGSDDLRRHVRRVNNSHGEEGIELRTGSRLRFLARSKSSGRGFSPQRVIFDEAQELSRLAAEAIVPSMRAQWNKQAIYTGTVPGPEINNPDQFRRLRDRGRAGGSSRLAWAEWSPKGSDDPKTAPSIDLDDRRHWLAANPAIGFRVTEEALESDREAMESDGFAREALSIWPTTPDLDMDAAFGPGKWQDCQVEGSPPRPEALGLAVSIDQKWTSIAAAGGRHVGSVIRREGKKWAPAELRRLQDEHGCDVVLDSRGPAADLTKQLDDLGVRYRTTTTAEYMDACARLFDDVQEKEIEHGGYDELDRAVGSAQKRNVSDRWAWARKTGDVSMLEAATLARWLATVDYDVNDSIG